MIPTKRPKRHENGLLAFTRDWEAWQPWPTPGEAHLAFADPSFRLRPEDIATARLVIGGEVVAEKEIRADSES